MYGWLILNASRPTITLGIVNYNGAAFLPRLLSSLDNQTVDFRTTIIDNASTDGSLRAAYEAFPQFDFLPLRRNTGFAHAANLIAQRTASDIVCYVNPDTVLAPDFVERITEPFSWSPQIGAVAGTMVFDADPSLIASAGIEIHRNGVAIDRHLGQEVCNQDPEPIFGASGGAAAFRRTAFLDAGGFPDVFFMYLEDVDLAFRLQLNGWDAVWQPAAVARHAYSASAVEGSPFKRKLIARNRVWTLARCLPQALWRDLAGPIALFDLLAAGNGVIRDRHSLRGRVEGLARIAPRLCERRAIDPDRGEVERIRSWLEPSLSPLALLRMRRLTARLARSG